MLFMIHTKNKAGSQILIFIYAFLSHLPVFVRTHIHTRICIFTCTYAHTTAHIILLFCACICKQPVHREPIIHI